MAQRHSGYKPAPGDLYCTPEWVTEALLSVEEFPEPFWEPAMGSGHMIDVLAAHRIEGTGSDISRGMNFLTSRLWVTPRSIITNPPYSNGLAEKFVRGALNLTEPVKGKVAMLLPLAWDSAKGRRDIFADHPAFKVKYTLTERIRWANLEQKKNGPSQNHAWFIWDWNHSVPPLAGYLP